MEIDRKAAFDAGTDIDRVRVWPDKSSLGETPDRLYVVEQRTDPITGQRTVHYRSFDNVPPGSLPVSAGTGTGAADPS
jgi:hypothetical protein